MALSKIGSNQIDSAASLTVSGTTKVADGTESAPSIVFDTDTNTGIYKKANDKLGFVTGGTERMRITDLGRIEFEVPTNQTGTLQDQRLDWRNENNAGIMASIAVHREANTLAPAALVFRTSTNVDSASNSSDGEISEKMRISSGGIVTTPNSLAVSSYLNTTHTHTVNQPSKVNNWSSSTGSSGPSFSSSRHHSSFDYTNSRFVAPVAGLYMMVYKPDYDRSITTNHYVSFGINGATRSFDVLEDLPQNNNSGANYHAYLQLNANDYVELYTHGGAAYALRGGNGLQWQTWWFIIQLG